MQLACTVGGDPGDGRSDLWAACLLSGDSKPCLRKARIKLAAKLTSETVLASSRESVCLFARATFCSHLANCSTEPDISRRKKENSMHGMSLRTPSYLPTPVQHAGGGWGT